MTSRSPLLRINNPRTFHLLNACVLIVLGMLTTFAFAPYGVYPLAIIFPAILLLFWVNASAKTALWQGFFFGVGFFGLGVYWIFISIHDYGEVPTLLALIITAGVIVILSSYLAATGYLLNRYFSVNLRVKMLLAFPAVWVSLEWVRSWFLSGFAWLFIGYSQTNSYLRGFAPIFSVYGVSLAACVCSGFLAYLLLKAYEKSYREMLWPFLGILLVALAGALLDQIAWTKPTGESVPVGLVQGNIPQQIKWSPSFIQLSLDRYEELTAPLWGKNKLIIWPETAIPITLQDAMDYVSRLDQKATLTNTHLILGIPVLSEKQNGYYNAIITLGKDKGQYLKRHLVPFGEYVPFGPLVFRLLNFMNIPVSVIVPGSPEQKLLRVGDLNILPTICYEITFPELIYHNDPSISFLLTLTNDAWYGKSNAQAQHLQMAAMRAIEFRRPVFMVSNDGITALITPQGKIKTRAPAYEDYVLSTTVEPTVGLTPWMRNGIDSILFVLLCFYYFAIRQMRTDKARALEANALYNQN